MLTHWLLNNILPRWSWDCSLQTNTLNLSWAVKEIACIPNLIAETRKWPMNKAGGGRTGRTKPEGSVVALPLRSALADYSKKGQFLQSPGQIIHTHLLIGFFTSSLSESWEIEVVPKKEVLIIEGSASISCKLEWAGSLVWTHSTAYTVEGQ